MYRITALQTLLSLVFVTVCGTCSAQDEAELVDAWSDKLVSDTNQLVRDAKQMFESEALELRLSEVLCHRAAYALALAGRAEKAISLSRENLDEAAFLVALGFIADAQSTSDDVAGAFRTAALLPRGRRTHRVRAAIAIRQAQRGDLADSVRLIDKISNEEQENIARKIVVREMVEAHRYREALVQYSLVKGTDARENVRSSMELARRHVEPGDPDYIERTIDKMRKLKTIVGGLSRNDAALLRLECQARVAIHEKDEESFRQSIDQARRLIAEWDRDDRNAALLSIATICFEFGGNQLARELFTKVFDTIPEPGEAKQGDDHHKLYLRLNSSDRFEAIAQVMSDAELRFLSERLVALDVSPLRFVAMGSGIAAAGKNDVASDIYNELQQMEQKVEFSTGVLEGMARRAQPPAPSPQTEKPTENEEQQQSLAVIDRIIADKPPLEFATTGSHRPKRDYLGPYNVSRKAIPDYDGEDWQETQELPELTLEEFMTVRTDVVLALWGTGSVYGFPTSEGEHDFFVYDDKFFDRTQKIEIKPSDHLPEILPQAVAQVQAALAKHPLWRVMVIGDGAQPRDQFFVIYPDAIRIVQARENDSMAQAIEANAESRSAKK